MFTEQDSPDAVCHVFESLYFPLNFDLSPPVGEVTLTNISISFWCYRQHQLDFDPKILLGAALKLEHNV